MHSYRDELRQEFDNLVAKRQRAAGSGDQQQVERIDSQLEEIHQRTQSFVTIDHRRRP